MTRFEACSFTRSVPNSLFVLFMSIALWSGCWTPGVGDGEADGAPDYEEAPPPDAVEGEFLVKFKPGADSNVADGVLRSVGARVLRTFPGIGVMHVRVSGDSSTAAALLVSDPSVLYAEPNYIVHGAAPDTFDTTPDGFELVLRPRDAAQRALETVPNDPEFVTLWGLHNRGQTGGTLDADIDAPEAWSVTTGSSEVLVGIISTGIDIDHPDLVDNLWVNAVEAHGTAGVDDDNNGYVDDIHGINAVTGTGNPDDDRGDGTHLAGIIGARGNNGFGVVGVNWRVKIVSCKASYPGGGIDLANQIECLQYLTKLGPVAINVTWAYPFDVYSQAQKDAIDAAGHAGSLVAAPVGPGNSDRRPWYPAGYTSTNLIAVTGTDHQDHLVDTGTGRRSVDVAAPGKLVRSTWYDGGYRTMDSGATGYTVGLIALLKAQYPTATAADLKARIMLTVDPLGLDIASGGRINAFRALTAELNDPFISSIDPQEGHPLEVVTLSGIHFGAEQGAGSVHFTDSVGNITPCAASSWGDNEVVCLVPALNEGDYDVTVSTDAQGPTNSIPFTMLGPPLYDEQVVEHEFLGGGVPLGYVDSSFCPPYALPFTFNYYNTDYDSIRICSNGYIDFASWFSDPFNDDIELTEHVRIAPLWNAIDLWNIYVHQPTPTTLAIRWEGETYDDTVGYSPLNVELVLDSVDGSIRFNYGTGNAGLAPTVGISEGNGQRYHVAPHNGAASLAEAPSILYRRSPGIALSGTSLAQTLCTPADLTDIMVAVIGKNQFTDPVAIEFVDLPDGFEGSLTGSTVTPPGQTIAEVSADETVASGTHHFGIRASAPGIATQTLAASIETFDGPPGTASLAGPANGSSGVSPRDISFQWGEVPNAQSYVLEVSRDATFETIDYTAAVEGTSHTVHTELARGTRYAWRVRSQSPCGADSISEPFTFTTANLICSAPDLAISNTSVSEVSDALLITDVGTVTDLNLKLSVSHSFVGDLRLILTHEETGTSVTVIDRPGVPGTSDGCSGNDIEATLDDSAALPVESACAEIPPAINGRFVPNQPLAAFIDEGLGGTWTLTAIDNYPSDGGAIHEWCLVVTTYADSDADGVADGEDNCLHAANPTQRDTNGDGFGNACDADYDNDGVVGISDFNTLRLQFGKSAADPDFNPDVDCDDNDMIGLSDFNCFRDQFGSPPG